MALSSPARGMWIEICLVSLLDAVDNGHPPHGGCGLKSPAAITPAIATGHPPHGGCGLK